MKAIPGLSNTTGLVLFICRDRAAGEVARPSSTSERIAFSRDFTDHSIDKPMLVSHFWRQVTTEDEEDVEERKAQEEVARYLLPTSELLKLVEKFPPPQSWYEEQDKPF